MKIKFISATLRNGDRLSLRPDLFFSFFFFISKSRRDLLNNLFECAVHQSIQWRCQKDLYSRDNYRVSHSNAFIAFSGSSFGLMCSPFQHCCPRVCNISSVTLLSRVLVTVAFMSYKRGLHSLYPRS